MLLLLPIYDIMKTAGDNMKARRELNERLYSQKANGRDSEVRHIPTNDYSDICRGDVPEVQEKLSGQLLSLQNNKRVLSDDLLANLKYLFVLESEEIAKAVISSGMGHDEAYALADIYSRKADIGRDEKGLNELYSDMCIDFAIRMAEIKKESAHSLHIRKCIAYIYQNQNADLSVKGLASYLGLNPSYLSKLFSKEVGTTLKRFVTEARISTACDLLKNTDLPNIEIAYSLGFATQSMFIRIFKAYMGVTPKKYRENVYICK